MAEVKDDQIVKPTENQRPTFLDLPDYNILSGEKKRDVLNPNSCFISYHQSDLAIATTIKALISGGQRQVWIDFVESAKNAEWLDTVYKGIENSDVFIFILSPDSNSSQVNMMELQHAVRNGKRLVPVCVRPVDYKTVLKELAVINWIMFTNSNRSQQERAADFKKTAHLLLSTVDHYPLHVQYHTKILRRSIEWERHDFEKSLLLHGTDLQRAKHWLSAAALGREPKPTTLHLSFITASEALDTNMKRRRVIALFFAVIVTIGIIWPSWGVFFFSLVFSHFFVYFSSV